MLSQSIMLTMPPPLPPPHQLWFVTILSIVLVNGAVRMHKTLTRWSAGPEGA